MLSCPSLLRCLAVLALPLASLVACGSGGAGQSGELFAESQSEALSSDINIGFGGAHKHSGDAFQFGAIHDFFNASVVTPAPRLCHLYVAWDIALPTTNGKILGEGRELSDWLGDRKPGDDTSSQAIAPNPCEEVLVSFKGTKAEGGAEPTGLDDDPASCPRCFGTAFRAFLVKYWDTWASKAPTDRAHVFSFTAWNEPNNGHDAGDGRGKALSPEVAALYYLMARKICNEAAYGCKVAAGDMASNTPFIDQFATNCEDDDVGPKACGKASWLDDYKVSIANHANDARFGFGAKFKPDIWAYHAWQEINDYTYYRDKHPDPCNGQDTDCATGLMVRALKGDRWKGAELWDTEVGVGQQGARRGDVDDRTQAEGAAYLLKVSAAAGVSRIYYQGVEDDTDPWRITCGVRRRPSWDVLAKRQTTFAGSATDGVCTTPQAEVRADVAEATVCPPGTHPVADAGALDAPSPVDGGGGLLTSVGPLIFCVANAGSPELLDGGVGGGLIK
jgi:hypothetical protein